MKKQTPPPQQANRPKSNAQNNPPQQPAKGQPVANDKAQPQVPQLGSSTSINNLVSAVRRNSMIRRLSQRRTTKLQQEEQNRPNWKSLSTGLEMLFSEEQVKKIWSFDKPKMIISELLHDLLRRLDVQKNFEKFHLYNLIFAKQKLFLDNYKSAVFLNLMWTLLINDNPDYKVLHLNYTRATIQSIEDINRRNSLQNIAGRVPTQTEKITSRVLGSQQKTSSLQNISESLKTIKGDLDNFKKWILKHSAHDPPNSIQIFDAQQVQMIVEFAQNSYFSNFALYNYCLNNKKKNEEIEIQLFIDKPLDIPPLSDALYMGQPKIEIPEDEDDDPSSKQRQKQKKVSHIDSRQRVQSNSQIDKLSGKNSLQGESIEKADSEASRLRGEEIEENNFDDQQYDGEEGEFDDDNLQKHSSQSNRSRRVDPEEQEIRNIVHTKLKSIEEQFSQTLQKRQEELDKQYDDIVNPKKKK